MNEFSELRSLANETLQVAAARIGVSTTKLWNFENGRANATLTVDQLMALRLHYGRLIKERLARIVSLLSVVDLTRS